MTWLWDRQKLPKSHFYVFYLGAKETTDMKSEENCMEIMTTQLSECFTQIPNKATVSISYKGLKLTQNIPMLSKHGNIKMRPVQLSVPAHCITFAMLGKAPFNDTLAVTMIVLNPELIKPLHTHVYRYDTCLTASLMHEKLQYLIHLPANQKALYNLEQRLYLPPVIKNKYETSTIPSRKDNCLTFREERSSNNLNVNGSIFDEELETSRKSAIIKEPREPKLHKFKKLTLKTHFQYLQCERYFKTRCTFNVHKRKRCCQQLMDFAEHFNKTETAANILAKIEAHPADKDGCYVYVLIDPRVVRNNWTRADVKNGIRYGVCHLFPEMKDQVAELILDEFSVANEKSSIVLN
uniref:DUF4780 domain-containing protein n=1 Tax=Rhabditophanes sp. KR3021 TaxID=114890 RepID=A0AC35U0I0_9BILA